MGSPGDPLARRLKVVFKKGRLFEVGVDGFVRGCDFQVFGVFNEQVDIPALGADPRLKGHFFLNTMVFADDHDQFEIPAGAEADLPLENTLVAAFTAGVGVAHIQPRSKGFRTEGKVWYFPNLPRFENQSEENYSTNTASRICAITSSLTLRKRVSETFLHKPDVRWCARG